MQIETTLIPCHHLAKDLIACDFSRLRALTLQWPSLSVRTINLNCYPQRQCGPALEITRLGQPYSNPHYEDVSQALIDSAETCSAFKKRREYQP